MRDPLSPQAVEAFRAEIYQYYRRSGRHDLPWRQTRDPYHILISEVMLQQTQVSRVIPKYQAFLAAFPDLASLAAAPLADVLRIWQGLGYNRRALALKRLAETVVAEHSAELPRDPAALRRLPGIGPATAAALGAFAFGQPVLLLETNVRAVFLEHFFPQQDGVSDREILPLVEATLDRRNPRDWYYALMDYGAVLKRGGPNPCRRSQHHSRQSPYAGSHRQLRARVLAAVLAAQDEGAGTASQRTEGTGTAGISDVGVTAEDIARRLGEDACRVARAAAELRAEGFLSGQEEGPFRTA